LHKKSNYSIFFGQTKSLLCIAKSISMNNQKKLIVIINEFPASLSQLTEMLHDDRVDFILDASTFQKPVSLLRVARPDCLLLNLHLPAKDAVILSGQSLSASADNKKAMITGNIRAYYMSLCNTFGSGYLIESGMDFELIPGAVAKQQLN
jgi:hypothetical protein